MKTAAKTESERRAFVEKVRQENEIHYGGPARRAVGSFLSAGLPHPWTYVYELTQNALDAGAHRVSWQLIDNGLRFQHDGPTALDESHVRGIASLGASTKGLSHVGFMGVGFKSIFARFRTARVSGFGFLFRFDVGSRRGDLGQTITHWFDTLRPHWDEDARDPDRGYTTSFSLERPVDSMSSVANDLERISSDPTPLAVLALRGLQHVRVDAIEWDLAADDDGSVVVTRTGSGERTTTRRWKSFVSRYRPDNDAMRRFLEVRQDMHDQVGDDGQRTNREVVGLVPLDDEGLPNPPRHGRVYATLPTQAQIPFGFHLQADWFVDIDRQNLRDVEGDAWQELIVRQVPDIVRQFLVWLTGQSEDARKRGYRALCDPNTDDGGLSRPFQALRDHFVDALAGESVVPIHGVGHRRFRTPDGVSRLPGRFSVDFGSRSEWRPDLLFGCDLMDEELLSKSSATAFFAWLGWGADIDRNNVPWPGSLPQWWDSLPERTRADALFGLWHGVQDGDWLDAPVVPTEAGTWVRMSDIRWLDEALPTASNPGGAVVTEILSDSLPSAGERVPPSIRASVEKSDSEGTRHFQSNRTDVQLSSLVEIALDSIEGDHDRRLVSLLEWAMSRGNRQDFVPWVLTEQGATRPADALLADPLVEDARSRRTVCPDKSALVKDYESIDDRRAVVRFLEQLGVYSGNPLREQKTHLSRYDTGEVARILGKEEREVRMFQRANVDGYTVFDYDFPFRLDEMDLDALQNVLSREHTYLRDKGHPEVRWNYRGDHTRSVPGTAAWVRSLQSYPWVPCSDGQRRKPADVLLERDPDFEDAPIGEIDPSLADRLKEEGVRFGFGIQKSPALRRLLKRGAGDLPDSELAALLQEAIREVDLGNMTREDFLEVLNNDVRLHRVPLARVVQRTGAGSGQRSDLGGWVVALADVEPPLAAAVRALPLSPSIPETTTGRHALGYLHDIWTKQPKVEAIRGSLAAAYRYVLDDVDSGKLPDEEWQQALAHARVYGQIGWHAISGALVVADVQSPLILRSLPEGRTIVASAHLGDSDDQLRRVARALGLGLLSDDVKVSPGARVDDPPYVVHLRRLLRALSSLEGRREIRIAFHDEIMLHVSGVEHCISAYVDDGTLLLVGQPPTFAADAAEQLVGHFRLSQRANVVPYLTMALFSLNDEAVFRHHLQVVADGLDVDVPEDEPVRVPVGALDQADEVEIDDQPFDGRDNTDHEKSDRRTDEPRTSAGTPAGGDIKAGRSQSGSDDSRSGPGSSSAADGSSRRSEATTQDPKNGGPPHGGRAADQFGLFVVPSARDEHESEGDQQHRTSGHWKDDRKARKAVIKYEEDRGWSAKEMSDNHPGFDVRSVYISAEGEHQIVRNIEVKGVRGVFNGDASVLLSSRQVREALKEHGHGVEYWLYVVDSTETERPRVFAIPWTQHRSTLRYGFYAHMWTRMAEQPTDTI